MVKCRYCEKEASYHITSLSEGRPDTYHVCEDHINENQPVADGVIAPVMCPRCGGRMQPGIAFEPITGERNQAKWIKSFFHCSDCNYQMGPPDPGTA